MLNSPVTIDLAAHSAVSDLCEEFIRRSGAICALLVGQDGMPLHRCGSLVDLDVDSLSALSAGTFASTREMAGLIGESDFDVVIQQGRRHHLQVIRAGDCAILVVVFDDRTTAAMVRLHGQRLTRRLGRLLAAGEEGATPPWAGAAGEDADPLAARTGDDLERADPLGPVPTRAEQLRAALQLRTVSLAVALLAAALALVGAVLRH